MIRKRSPSSLPRRSRHPHGAVPAAALAVLGILASASCTSAADRTADPLAFTDDEAESANTTPTTIAATTASTTTTTVATTTTIARPVPLGREGEPFAPLPESDQARALVTETGVVLPVLDDRTALPGTAEAGRGMLALTACEDVRFVDGTPIGRAHIVLDPGHGGTEVGSAGPGGFGDEPVIRETDLNLTVSLETKRLLEEFGATVVLTRTGDYNITTGARGVLAKRIAPALFVSVHHNGGGTPNGDRPGTLAYAKTGNQAAARFGGLFYQHVTQAVAPYGQARQVAYEAYAAALDQHEAAIDAYDQSVAAREAALIANGQLPPEAGTTPGTRPEADETGLRIARQRAPGPTTTQPPNTFTTNAEFAPVPVPETLAPPAALAMEPVRPFRWAGVGNSGVRAWTRADGKDYLSVLRHSGDVPAVLVEFLYVSNPAEAALLADQAFLNTEAAALADAIVDYFSSPAAAGSGHVADEFDDQPIGGGGHPRGCVEPALTATETALD